MWGGRGMMMVGMACALSGCASGGYRQDVTRLQSQIRLLDERLAQLERSAPAGTPTAAFSDGGFGASAAIPSEQGTSISVKASVGPSEKPKTSEVQRALKNAGFYQGALDGKMGPRTRQAVKEFQRVHGLHDDGVVGRATWSKLRAYAELSGGGEPNPTQAVK